MSISAAILLGLLAFFLLRRRRRENPTRGVPRKGSGPGGYHYVPARPSSPVRASQIETVEGRRISFSLPAPNPQARTQHPKPSRPPQSRNRTNAGEGHIEPFTLHLGPSSQQPPLTTSENHQLRRPPHSSPQPRNAENHTSSPTQDITSPAETNWSSFYTSPATMEGRAGGTNQPWSMLVSASDGGSSVIQSGTGAATYADSSEGDHGGRSMPPVYNYTTTR